jgi:8-oxo-dGTP pyrophosphatase MutT (NUDIX family)
VEVFAVQDGKLYCGEYKDGSIGVFGGGTDGESLEETAKREFKEETGYDIKKIQKIPIDPVEVLWGEPKSDKQKERAEKYKGTKTWYFWGEFDNSKEKEKSKGEDGEHGLKNVSLKTIDDDLIKKFTSKTDDDGIIKQQKVRTEAINYVLDQIKSDQE